MVNGKGDMVNMDPLDIGPGEARKLSSGGWRPPLEVDVPNPNGEQDWGDATTTEDPLHGRLVGEPLNNISKAFGEVTGM